MMKKRIVLFVIAALLVVSGSMLMGPGYLRAAELQGQDLGYTKININSASQEDLIEVRGIGPVIADRIVKHRDENGNFESLDDLANVRGIGGSRFQSIREQLTV